MASWNKITAGDTLYDVRRRVGLRSGLEVWPVKVVSVDSVTETAVIEWNGNKPREVTRKQLEAYRVKRPGSDRAVARKTFVHGQDVEVCVRNGPGKSWHPAKYERPAGTPGVHLVRHGWMSLEYGTRDVRAKAGAK